MSPFGPWLTSSGKRILSAPGAKAPPDAGRSRDRSVAVTTRRAKHPSDFQKRVKPARRKYISFRKTEFMI